MKALSQYIFFVALIFISGNAKSQTFTYQNTLTPAQLVQDVLIGNGITAFNVTYNGIAASAQTTQLSAQTFTATAGFPFPSGVNLKTAGSAMVFDADLTAIALGSPTNGTIIEFDFIATGDTLNFEYVFASTEYANYTCSNFNDAFGFFLSGPGISGPYANSAVNVALVPGTNVPVSINTVNSGFPSGFGSASTCAAADPNWQANAVYFTTSYGNFTGQGYTGSTTNLLAVSNLVCGGTYHIKLAICNVMDTGLDSGVFLKSESFVSNVVTIETHAQILGSFTDTLLAEDCVSTELLFIRPSFYTDTVQTFTISYNGNATAADFTTLPTSIVFPIGVDSVSYIISPIADGLTEPMEWIEIKGYTITVCGDTLYDSLTLYIVDHYDFTFDVPDTVFALCISDMPMVTVTNIDGSVGPYETNWSYGDTQNPTYFPNNGIHPDTIQYIVSVVDICGWTVQDSVILVVDDIPIQLQLIPNDTLTVDCIPDSALVSVLITAGGGGPYTYAWSNGDTNSSTYIFDGGVNNVDIPFIVNVSNGCSSAGTAFGILQVRQTLQVSSTLSTPAASCLPNGSITGVVSGQTGPVDYLWFGPGLGSPNTYPSATVNNLPPGTYYLIATDNVCAATGNVTVDALSAPIASATATPFVGVAPMNVILSNNSQNAITYSWDFGNGEVANTFNLNSVSTNYPDSGQYIVQLIATDAAGCADTTNITIIVNFIFKPAWEIPNVFSPNGDLANDFFFIETENVKTIHMQIFNRWGNTMFDQTSANPSWNGLTKSGNPADDGVYFYKILLNGISGHTVSLDGFFHLVR
ncbi:MAG: choice-of-anchor L domain-containing protein [Crocinitomicaceae bacterium]